MRKKRKNWFAKIIFFKLVMASVLILVVMLLWNHVLVTVLGLRPVTYFQAVGLVILARILTGNIGWMGGRGPGGMMHQRGMMRDRWKQMNEEERKNWMMGMGKWSGRDAGGPEQAGKP